MFIFYEFIFEMPREALFIMLCYVMLREANKFFKKLADKLSRKSGQRYSEAMTFIRKRVRFDLLRTTFIALRGERGLKSSSAVKIAELDINLEPVL